jgi:hypothetical protein
VASIKASFLELKNNRIPIIWGLSWKKILLLKFRY